MGGGLGHLTRAVAFLHTMSLGGRAAVITASPWSDDPRVMGSVRAIRPPAALEDDPERFGGWIRSVLAVEKPERFVVDSFPAGITGELSGLTSGLRFSTWHVARLLKWPAYAKRIRGASLPIYDLVWETETLHPEHEAALRPVHREWRKLTLSDPVPSSAVPRIDGRHWLVVHSGPDDEVDDLLHYAVETRARERADVRIVLVSPVRPQVTAPEITMVDVYPAWPLFDDAERIITAAGFNAMRQAASFRDKHRFIPFPRALDDQYTRAARARRG